MPRRLPLLLALLLLLVAANFGYRWWLNRGLITIDAADAPLSEVIKSIERQGGVRLLSNAPEGAKVTMHVHQVPLRRALAVLSNNTGLKWNLTYFVAPSKAAVDGALATFDGQQVSGWKKFELPLAPIPGMEDSGDPREQRWDAVAAEDGNVQGYLQQGAQYVTAQFWAPQDWNPPVATIPDPALVGRVVRELAASVQGYSEEVFTLATVPGPGEMPFQSGRTAGGRDGGFRPGSMMPPGPPPADGFDPVVGQAIEKRQLARIERLKGDAQTEARAEYQAQKDFYIAMMKLPPEERADKMREHIEEDIQKGKMGDNFTRMDAMHTVEQRNAFFKNVVQFRKTNQEK
jgi:hypothetical protein